MNVFFSPILLYFIRFLRISTELISFSWILFEPYSLLLHNIGMDLLLLCFYWTQYRICLVFTGFNWFEPFSFCFCFFSFPFLPAGSDWMEASDGIDGPSKKETKKKVKKQNKKRTRSRNALGTGATLTQNGRRHNERHNKK